MIIDISRTLNQDTPTWPGDTPFSYELSWSKEETGSVNVGQLTTSCHTATHIDAPYHFNDSGLTVEQLPLDLYVGDVLVIDVSTKGRISPDDLKLVDLSNVRRVILKTSAWKDPSYFPTEIPILDPSLGEFLRENGVELIGVDLPSVDPLESKTLDAHHAFEKNSIHILEGLNLEGVEPGEYRLTALPLKIEGADGSPVRAILETK
ncbi:arylformamidase [Alkalibacillus haloalkaliphilus]|uniref:arylformamidase n=1 Tax=Alkalibacillus haloalkaliphilus TaxID=94136 RepID=UPI0029367D96|nr:arylformamidase [Alkalibacillus haloalkaliphilus]MDV2581314.1 arylformamidase [Alkalibacillus haloalkaliphilus]